MWIRTDLWVPALSPAQARERMPEVLKQPMHLLICSHQNWLFARRDVEDENPQWPIRLVSPGRNVDGYRFTGYTVSPHCFPFTQRDRDWLRMGVEPAVIVDPG